MLERFASAALVASVAIATAAVIALLIPGLTLQQMSPILLVWCAAPCVWGLWAMIAPPSWVPRRLPAWGAILGAVAAILGAFALNLPARVLGFPIPAVLRACGVVVMVIFYFFVWSIVGLVYQKLHVLTPAEKAQPELRL